MQSQEQAQQLIDRINRLPPERIAEVVDFVDFLKDRDEDQALSRMASRVSEPSLAKLWDNSEDAVYDEL